MGILDGAKVDTMTYWANGGPDSVGDPTFGSPETREVRWENRNELFYGADGGERQSESVIYSDEAASIGDFVYRGTSAQADPRDQTGYRQIQAVQETKSLDGSESVYKILV